MSWNKIFNGLGEVTEMETWVEDWRVPDLGWLPAFMLQIRQPWKERLILPFPEIGAVIVLNPLFPMTHSEDNFLRVMHEILTPTGAWIGGSSLVYLPVHSVHREFARRRQPYSPSLLDAVSQKLFSPQRKKKRGRDEEIIIDPQVDQKSTARKIFKSIWPELYHSIEVARNSSAANPTDEAIQTSLFEALARDCIVNEHPLPETGSIPYYDLRSAFERSRDPCDPLKWFIACNWLRLCLYRRRPAEILDVVSLFFQPTVKAETLARSLRRWGLRTILPTGPRDRTTPAPKPPAPIPPPELKLNAPPHALLLNGLMYLAATPPEFHVAETLFEAAADAGNCDAMYQLARIHQDNTRPGHSKPGTAVSWLEKAGKLGHAKALHELASMKLASSPSKEDRVAGTKLLIRAAKAHCAQAQLELADRLLKGDAIRKNAPKALRWLKQAAVNGSKEAQFTLGKCTLICATESLAWLMVAADELEDAKKMLLQVRRKNKKEWDAARCLAASFREKICIASERQPALTII